MHFDGTCTCHNKNNNTGQCGGKSSLALLANVLKMCLFCAQKPLQCVFMKICFTIMSRCICLKHVGNEQYKDGKSAV